MMEEPLKETRPVLLTDDDESIGFPIRLNVSGRTVHRALKQLITGHFGITREMVVGEIIRRVNIPEVLSGVRLSMKMEETIRSLVREAIGPEIKTQMKQMIDEAIRDRVAITLK